MTESRKWLIVDANMCILGRLSSKVASFLRGKHKPIMTPGADCGDCVIVINSSKIRVTGKKMTDKLIQWHTGFVGGLKERMLKDQLSLDSTKVIRKAVAGMLPRGALGNLQLSRLKIYANSEHMHTAQKPTEMVI